MPDESIAANIIDFLKVGKVSSLAVASSAVVYTHSVPMPRQAAFVWVVRFDSPGAVNAKIDLEQSDVRPETEGAVDTQYVVPDGGAVITAGIVDELVHRIGFAPKVAGYCRLKITGLGTGTPNDAGTTLNQAQVVYVR